MTDDSDMATRLRQRIAEFASGGHSDAIELLLAEHPDVRSDSKLLLECVRIESSIHRDRGQAISVEDYVRRFPEYADELRALFVEQSEEKRQAATGIAIAARPGAGETPSGVGSTLDFSQSSHSEETFVPAGATAPPAPGRIGRYEILHEIARGGMGVVYKAFDPQLDRTVAVKLIKAGEFADPAQVQRFRFEAQAAAQLHHSGIVPVYEVGQNESQHYLAMEFVEGRSLSRGPSEGPLEPPQAAALMRQIAEAVQYAHDRGVIHRDLKPQNILLGTDGRPRVLDFGLAKRPQKDSSLTETGQILGTPSYMSPEQAQGQTSRIGRHSDVYSLGATLYCLLTARPPFLGESQFETIQNVVDKEPLPPSKLNKSVPRDLETICLKCLRKQPEQRYASAQALADDLERFLRGDPIQARRVGRVERASRWLVRRWIAVIVVCLLVGQGIILSLGTFSRSDLKQQPRQDGIQPDSPSATAPSPAAPKDPPEPDPNREPARDLVPGSLRRELFDGKSLTGWRGVNGSFGLAHPPTIGPVMSADGVVHCVLVNSADEELKNYRLTLTVYTNEAESFVVQFGEVRDADVPSSHYGLVLSPSGSFLEHSAADGRERKRISDIAPFTWNREVPHSITIELQHGWWFVTVDDSMPIAAPRGKREPLRTIGIISHGRGPAWIKSVTLQDLVETTK